MKRRNVSRNAGISRQAWSDGPVNFRRILHYDGVDIYQALKRPSAHLGRRDAHGETFRGAGVNGYDLMTVPFIHPTTDALRDWCGCTAASWRAPATTSWAATCSEVSYYVSDSLRGPARSRRYEKLQRYSHRGRSQLKSPARYRSDCARIYHCRRSERCCDTIRRWQRGWDHGILGNFHFGGMPQRWRSKACVCSPTG